MKTLNLDKINNKKSKGKKIKEFLAISLLSTSLIFSSCEGGKNISNDTNSPKIDIEQTTDDEDNKEEIKVDDEKKEQDEEMNDIDTNIVDEDIDTEINDSDQVENKKEWELECEKECWNPFTIIESLSKECNPYYKIYSKNNVESQYIYSIHCSLKENIDKLKQKIKETDDPLEAEFIGDYIRRTANEYKNATINICRRLKKGKIFKLKELANPEHSNNDDYEGYETSFEILSNFDNPETLSLVDLETRNLPAKWEFEWKNGSDEIEKVSDDNSLYNSINHIMEWKGSATGWDWEITIVGDIVSAYGFQYSFDVPDSPTMGIDWGSVIELSVIRFKEYDMDTSDGYSEKCEKTVNDYTIEFVEKIKNN